MLLDDCIVFDKSGRLVDIDLLGCVVLLEGDGTTSILKDISAGNSVAELDRNDNEADEEVILVVVSVLLTDRVLLVGPGSIALGDTGLLKNDIDIEDNFVLNGATTMVDIDSDVLENSTSTVSRGTMVEDISAVFVDGNSIDDDIIGLLEDVVLIGTVALRDSIALEIEPVALLEIIVGVITLLNDNTVFLADCGISMILVDTVVWKLVIVNIIAAVDLITLSNVAVGDTSLCATHLSFKPVQFPLARLKVHSVTCLLFRPPNSNPSLLTLVSESHNK